MSEDEKKKPEIDLDNIDDELKAMQAELDQDGPAGDKPGAGPAPENQSLNETKQAFMMILGPAFEMITPAWNIQLQEVEALSEAYAALIEKYWPGGLSGFGVELNAALITLAIFAPRLKVPRKAEPEKADDKETPKEQV